MKCIYKATLSYCLKFRKNTESKNTKVVKSKKKKKKKKNPKEKKNNAFIKICSVQCVKNSKFIKQQEASGIKTPSIKIPNSFKTAWIYV